MARADYIERVKGILYGTDLGEAPSIRVGASNANESTSGSLVTFTLADYEGDKVRAGQILSAVDDTDPTNCFAIYVTSVAGNKITGVNGYRGSPSVTGSDSGDLDSAVLEQNPIVTDFKIHKAVDTIFATALWPRVYNIETTTVTPDLSTGQVEVPAGTMKILRAAQVSGNRRYFVPASIQRNEHTTVSSTGVLADIEFMDGSTTYLTTMTKLVLTDEVEATNGLIEMVSTGAAALCLGAVVSESDLSRSAKESQVRGRRDVAGMLWRDFLTLRDAYSEGLGREVGDQMYVNRG